MRHFSIIAVFSIVWALMGPLYVYFRDTRDEQERGMRCIGSLILSNVEEYYADFNLLTNITTGNVNILYKIADREHERSIRFWWIRWISSAIIVILSVCILKAGSKQCGRTGAGINGTT
jgi:hypothetical protein